jgi:hypothetical protein
MNIPHDRPLPGQLPRVINTPLKYRDGDDLIQRWKNGDVNITFGYYLPAQERARKLAAAAFVRGMNEFKMPWERRP